MVIAMEESGQPLLGENPNIMEFITEVGEDDEPSTKANLWLPKFKFENNLELRDFF